MQMAKKFGTRQEVWDGECMMTRGGLTKDDLVLSKTGRLVSRKKSEAARASYAKFGFKKRAQEQEPEEAPKPKRRRRRRKKASEDE